MYESISPEQWAYLAGFVDGEGCIASYKHGQSGQYYSKMTVTQVNPAPLKWAQSLWGGWAFKGKKYNQPEYEAPWRWVTSGHKLTPILLGMLPYLQVRQREAKLAINLMRCRKSRTRQELIHYRLKEVKLNRGMEG